MTFNRPIKLIGVGEALIAFYKRNYAQVIGRERESGGGREEGRNGWREKMLTILYLIQFYNIIITT